MPFLGLRFVGAYDTGSKFLRFSCSWHVEASFNTKHTSVLKSERVAGEVAQQVKCLHGKREDLISST